MDRALRTARRATCRALSTLTPNFASPTACPPALSRTGRYKAAMERRDATAGASAASVAEDTPKLEVGMLRALPAFQVAVVRDS